MRERGRKMEVQKEGKRRERNKEKEKNSDYITVHTECGGLASLTHIKDRERKRLFVLC